MADAALFIGWGTPVRGRETKGLEVFNEALAFHGECQQAGQIESFDVVLLTPHGGELNGFILIKGSEAQIEALMRREDFQRINTRANLVVDRFGVVPGIMGETLGEQMAVYREAASEMEHATV
jgi:hypothetical protein